MKKIKEFDDALEIDESLNFKKKERDNVICKLLIAIIILFFILDLIFLLG